MTEYECWFCGKGIERLDARAVMIQVESFWRWNDGQRGEDGPWQTIFAHSACAKDKMRGATMNLEPSVFGEDDPESA